MSTCYCLSAKGTVVPVQLLLHASSKSCTVSCLTYYSCFHCLCFFGGHSVLRVKSAEAVAAIREAQQVQEENVILRNESSLEK
jgi:hypothetical protein